MKLKEKYTPEYIENNGLLLMKVLMGSFSQNLNTVNSDKDYCGIFILEREDYYSLEYQKNPIDTVISNDPDVTYFEISKFIDLLSKGNPNAIEMLASSLIKENTIYKNEILNDIKISDVISKQCMYTFGKYASTQIKKAKGLNKKMNNPIPIKRKEIIDFCYFYNDEFKMPLKKYLNDLNRDQLFCGLKNINNIKNTYKLYYDVIADMCFNINRLLCDRLKYKKYRKSQNKPLGYGFKGIQKTNDKIDSESNQIRVSSIPKDKTNIQFLGFVYYNLEGYETYCKEYTEYQEWLKKRNPERYKNNIGQKYDVKNLSHCARLLTIAKEIAINNEVNLWRNNDSEFFKSIKLGKINYNIVLDYSNNIINDLNDLYEKSNLPENPNINKLNNILIKIRKLKYLS